MNISSTGRKPRRETRIAMRPLPVVSYTRLLDSSSSLLLYISLPLLTSSLPSVGEQLGTPNWGVVIRSNDWSKIKPSEDLITTLRTPRLERYIGVIYRPDTERASHYSQTKFGEEFDAVLFLDQTTALVPLDHSKPWKQSHGRVGKLVKEDTDPFPELDGALTSTELVEWRISAAVALNALAMDMETKKGDLELAMEKYDKALKYLSVIGGMSEQQISALRNQIIVNKVTVKLQQRMYREAEELCRKVLSAESTNAQAKILIEKAREGRAGRHLLHEAPYHAADSALAGKVPKEENPLWPRSIAEMVSPAVTNKRKDLPNESA